MNEFYTASLAMKDKALFTHADLTLQDAAGAQLASHFGIHYFATPCIVAYDPLTKKMFRSGFGRLPEMLPLENMVAADLNKFVDDLVSGALTPYFKSQTVQPAEGAMAVIVGSNFDEIVLDTSKNVFNAYYGPQSEQSKKLLQYWTELAETFAERNDLIIAKYDATVNEAINAVNLPYFNSTMVLYTKEGKELKYASGQTLEELKQFVKSNGEGKKDEL